jgi:hypothetical protein
MAKQTFKTVDEGAEYIFSEEIEADMVAVPPEVDELTNDIAGTAEIFHEKDNEDIFQIFAKRARK